MKNDNLIKIKCRRIKYFDGFEGPKTLTVSVSKDMAECTMEGELVKPDCGMACEDLYDLVSEAVETETGASVESLVW